MKRIKLFFILLIIFILSGCYREESTLTINKDKSVDLEIKILVEDDFDEKDYIINSSIYDDRGIKVQRINEYGHKGYKIIKHYPNIDNISTEKDIKVDIYKYLDFDFDDSVLFKIEDGYFKDKYTAVFTIDYNLIKSKITPENNTKEEFLKEIKDIYGKLIQEYGNKKEALNIDNNNSVVNIGESYNYKMNIDEKGKVILFEIDNNQYKYKKENINISLDDIVINDISVLSNDDNKDSVITFVANTPRKAISNNATRISNNGKTMTWVLDSNNPLNEIMFTFDIPNNEHYVLVVGILLLSIIAFLILIVLTKNIFSSKKKKIENTIPIYTGYDSSIENEALKETKKINHKIISVKIKKEEKNKDNSLLNNNYDIIEINDEK